MDIEMDYIQQNVNKRTLSGRTIGVFFFPFYTFLGFPNFLNEPTFFIIRKQVRQRFSRD